MAWAPALLLCSPTAQAAVTQPSSLSANVGDTIRITCTGSSRSSGCGWHQQKVPGSGPVTVIYDNRRPSGVPSRFSRSTSSSTNTLTISGVQAEDEARSWDNLYHDLWTFWSLPVSASSGLMPTHPWRKQLCQRTLCL
uniref:Immunoglobulin V-set domain-containing protein n=1 Tax=Cyanoderma ruficeps TaxID=181631 RepID=A0A8C3NU29_9PASS